MVSVLEQINTFPGTWYAAWQNAFFSIPNHEAHLKKSAFSWHGQQYTFTVTPQGFINSPALCHNLTCKDLDHLSLPQGIILFRYNDDTMLTGPSEHAVATTLDLLVTHLQARGQEINPIQFQGPPTLVGELGVQ